MESFILIDCMPMVESEEDLPRTAIRSTEQLRHELERFRQREPASIIHLVSVAGEVLELGIGADFAGVRWLLTEQQGEKRMKMAVADRNYSETGAEFRFQGSDHGFRSKYVLPVETVIDVAIHYFETRELPKWLQWAEWPR